MYDEPTDEHIPAGSRPWDDQPTQPGGTPPPQPAYRPMPPAPRRPRRRRRRERWGCFKTAVSIALMALAALVGAGLIAGLAVYNSLAGELAEDLERLESMEGVEDFQTTRIYDRTGQVLLYEVFSEGRRTVVPLDQVPFALRWATIATEDSTFYENPGFEPTAITRAAWQWFREGEIVSGGSTITQQLVRQIVFDYEERNEQTLRRKLKEAALAWVMTRQFSKDEILELYLNEIYYGNLAYGIEEASNVYFDKPARELNIAEAAFLAGLPQSPATYDPYANFAVAKARQRQVLDLMVRHGHLSSADADAAFNMPPLVVTDLASPAVSLLAPHFTVEVRRQLAELPGMDAEMIARGGLTIYTTLDMGMQTLAEQIAASHVSELRDEYNLTNSALVAINPHTGEILAMVGSVDYNDETIDGAVNNILSLHQPGSSIKPLTYAAALEQGWEPADILWDVPVVYQTSVGEYEPRNYDGRFHGPVRLREGLANSYNIPAVLLLDEIGVPALLEIASRFGINSLEMDPARYGLSLTLGGGEVTPLEMATAFGVLANGGYQLEPHVVMRVVDSSGSEIYSADPGKGESVLDPRIAFMISDILSDNDARTPAMGADSPLRLDFPAAAKTGTTNDYRDNWTVGYTPHLVVAVWSGNTNNEPMAEGTSGQIGAAPIWQDFMTQAYALPGLARLLEQPDLPPLRGGFAPPPRVEQRRVCVLSSLVDPALAEDGCPRTRNEWFRVGGSDPAIAPTEVPTPTPVPTLVPVEDEEPRGPFPATRVMLEPGLWQIAVLPLDEERQALVVEALADEWDALPSRAPRPSPPLYCEVAQDTADPEVVEGMTYQVFIAAPADPILAIRARNWAMANRVPIEPGTACPVELIEEIVEEQELEPLIDPLTGATYYISSPRFNEEIFGIVPIIGTAIFDRERIEYYKVEIGFGAFPTEFLTLGDIHTEPVIDDVLEVLYGEGLPPGPYVLRLVLVRTDGNILPAFQIPVTVVPRPAEE